jgi:hypothetical protein
MQGPRYGHGGVYLQWSRDEGHGVEQGKELMG